MKLLQKRTNDILRQYDNQILLMAPMTDARSFFPETLKMSNMANITDGKKAYDKDNESTYAALTWASSAEEAKDFKSAPHYDANGTQNASGKYLCGFTQLRLTWNGSRIAASTGLLTPLHRVPRSNKQNMSNSALSRFGEQFDVVNHNFGWSVRNISSPTVF